MKFRATGVRSRDGNTVRQFALVNNREGRHIAIKALLRVATINDISRPFIAKSQLAFGEIILGTSHGTAQLLMP